MDSKTIAKGIRRYELEESSSFFLIIETFICSVMIGVYFESWAYFGLSLLFFFATSVIRPLGLIVTIVFSLFWAVIGVVIGMAFLESFIVAILFAVIAFVSSLGLHISGYEGLKV
jgi:hypothetical protein